MKKLIIYPTLNIIFKFKLSFLFILLIMCNKGWGQANEYEKILTSIANIKNIPSFSSNTVDNQLNIGVLSPNGSSDMTIIYFKGGNSDSLDMNDGSYLAPGNPLNTQIYSYINSDFTNKYCINALASYSAPISINIGFDPKVNGSFTITAEAIQSFNSSSSIILEDLKTNTTQDLRLNPTYTFNANTTDAINRFKVYFNLAYIWNVTAGNWNNATSWKPSRILPLNTDILVFDGSIQPSPSVVLDYTTSQNVGRLRVLNNANVSFVTSDASRILTIGVLGLDPPHLKIDSLSSLIVTANNPLTINILSACKGSIYGKLTFQNAAHKLIANDTNSIVFNNASIFTAGTALSGDVFGTSNLNAVVFAKGSNYIHKSTAPPSLNGRTFANFELNAIGFNNNISGNKGVTFDNLTITNCNTFGMNLAGTINIKGNLVVNSGLLSFSPASTATVIFNGTSIQSVSSGSGILTIGSNANFVIDNSVIIDRDITFGGNLTINAAKSLTIASGKQINVTAGFLIKSDSSGTGSFIHSNAVSGNMERYIPVTSTSDFHILASPVAAQVINSSFSPENQSFFAWNESNASWVPYENAGFTALNGGNYINPGKGYAVSYSSTSTKVFSGIFNQGTVSTNLTYTPGSFSGWNLIANPYPSSINWNTASGYARNMLEDAGFGDYAYWIWNPNSGNYGCFISNGFFGTNGVTNYIAPMQGFWVKSTIASTFSLNNNAREHFTSQPWLKTVVTSNNTIRLKVTTAENNYSDELIVSYGYNSDKCGAEKMFSYFQAAPEIFSAKYNKSWSINKLTNISDNKIIPIGFKTGKNGNYTISGSGLSSFDEVTYVYLKDLKTNTIHNLNQYPDYNFTATTNDSVMRFQLIVALSPLSLLNEQIQHTGIYSNKHTIYINSNESIQQITVYNTMGQLIRNFENLSGNNSIEMNGITSGYYIVRVLTTKNVYSEKIYIE